MIRSLLVDIALIGLVFGAGCLGFLAFAPLLGHHVDLRHRLAGTRPVSITRQASLRADTALSFWARVVKIIEAGGLSLADAKVGSLSARMVQAGFAQAHASRLFMLARVVLTLTLPLVVAVQMLVSGDPTPGQLYLYITGLALVGLYAPNVYISRRIRSRAREMLNGFPDTLDLMLICVEAGLSIDACFNRVGVEIRRSHPLLNEQFALVALELRAGRSREDALRGLVRRTAVPEIGSFVTLIIQSDRLGSSIAQALKGYAIEMREGRKMRAEEKAHRLPVLISIPLVAFMLPTMIAVLILPGAILIKRDLLPSLSAAK